MIALAGEQQKLASTNLFFHRKGNMDLLPMNNRPATLPTTQATTIEYMIALTQILRSCVSVPRSRISRIGCWFWSCGSLTNHIAPLRRSVLHPESKTASEYLPSEGKDVL
jgi:hypothetical protein